jgi:hypothetical protein
LGNLQEYIYQRIGSRTQQPGTAVASTPEPTLVSSQQ